MGPWGLLDCASEPHAACLKLTGLGTVARKLDSSDNMHLLCTSWMASGSLQGCGAAMQEPRGRAAATTTARRSNNRGLAAARRSTGAGQSDDDHDVCLISYHLRDHYGWQRVRITRVPAGKNPLG